MTTTRKRPTGRPTTATRRKPARKPAKAKRVNVRNPVVVTKRRRMPKRSTTATVGIALVTVIGLVVYLAVSLVAAVITGVIAGVAVGVATAVSQPGPPRQPQQARGAGQGMGTPAGGAKPGPTKATKAQPPGIVMCGAPTRDHGRCMRFTAQDQNCGIPGHPPPGESQPGASGKQPTKKKTQTAKRDEPVYTASVLRCTAPTGSGPCMRPIKPGSNCGIPGHPMPGGGA